MLDLAQKIDTLLQPLRNIADHIGYPIFDLTARIYVGWAFFKSGLTRFDSLMNGSWEDQVFLFTEEHPVPGIPGEIGAVLGTGGELILPILLFIGLFSRFSAAGLLIMTAIIEFTYTHSTDHVLWAFLLAMVFIKGSSTLSADHFLTKYLRK